MKQSSTTSAVAIPIEHMPLPATLAVTPGVSTGAIGLDGIPGLVCGVWEHSAGISTDVEQDEMFVVISGRGRIHLQDGTILELQPGTVGVLREGEATRWEIDEPLRKVWFTLDA